MIGRRGSGRLQQPAHPPGLQGGMPGRPEAQARAGGSAEQVFGANPGNTGQSDPRCSGQGRMGHGRGRQARGPTDEPRGHGRGMPGKQGTGPGGEEEGERFVERGVHRANAHGLEDRLHGIHNGGQHHQLDAKRDDGANAPLANKAGVAKHAKGHQNEGKAWTPDKIHRR